MFLGRYANGNTTYDRAAYLEFFNGPDYYNRNLCSANYRLENPRYNIAMGGHIENFINYVREEQANYCDGLFQRILFSAPPALSNTSVREMWDEDKLVNPKCSLLCILYTLDYVYAEDFNFKFEESAYYYLLESGPVHIY